MPLLPIGAHCQSSSIPDGSDLLFSTPSFPFPVMPQARRRAFKVLGLSREINFQMVDLHAMKKKHNRFILGNVSCFPCSLSPQPLFIPGWCCSTDYEARKTYFWGGPRPTISLWPPPPEQLGIHHLAVKKRKNIKLHPPPL